MVSGLDRTRPQPYPSVTTGHMRATFRICASALRVGVRSLLLAFPAHADSYSPDQEFTVGPSLAWGLGAEQETPVIVGGEVSYLPGGYFWATLGARCFFSAEDTTALVHAEGGVWLFATLGVGYSRRLTGDAFDANSLHLFIGEPIPFMEAFDAGMLFAEPYYRPTLGLSSTELIHELGVMLKFTTYQ